MSTRNQPFLTLEETLAGQKDLSHLCSDRPLITSEIFKPNAFYGNDLILKRYARLPQTRSLKVVIPHGTNISEDYIWEAEARAPLPAVLCYSQHREAVYMNKTKKVAMHSAHPLSYVVEMLKGQPRPDRRGTIFFPIHSTHYVTAQMNFETMAEELLNLGDEYQPVTVCVYWRDFNLGHHLPFQQRGLPVVSAGHMYDPAFLFRFYHLCSMHHYSASNSIGSSLFYSVKSGCSYFHLDTVKYSHVADDHILKRDTSRPSPEREIALQTLFSKPQPRTTAEQMEAVDYYLGTEYFRSPLELRHQLLYAEKLDKFGFSVHNQGQKARFVVPSYYRRAAMKPALGRRIKGVVRRAVGLWRRPL